ncbi:hypothetical protein N2152v2_002839 [Parachlorella kessleri]
MSTEGVPAGQAAAAVVHPPLPSSLGHARGEGYKNIAASEAHQLTEKGGAYLDVRTPEEYSEGHAPGAVNIPILVKEEGEFKPNPGFLDEVKSKFHDIEAPIVTACQHGRRGELAAQNLADAGFVNLSNLTGGFHAWVSSNLPSTKE